MPADRQHSRHSRGAGQPGALSSTIAATRSLVQSLNGEAWLAGVEKGAPLHSVAYRLPRLHACASLGFCASATTRISPLSLREAQSPRFIAPETLTQIDGEGEHRLSCRPPCEFRRLLSRVFHTTVCLPRLSVCTPIACAGIALHTASSLSTAYLSLPPASLHLLALSPLGSPLLVTVA